MTFIPTEPYGFGPADKKKYGAYSVPDFFRYLSKVPDSVYEDLARNPLIDSCDFAQATRCDHMLMRSHKKVFSGFLPLGEVKVVRNRWQMVGSSVVWPELRLTSAVIMRDLTKEAGFTSRTITSANLDPDDTRYVFERAFAGVRITDFNQMTEVSTHDICERLSWRSQFRLDRDNRNVATKALESFVNKSAEGICLADGMIGFKPYGKYSYAVNLTPCCKISGFKAPLIGHGWSCMLEHERPSHLQGIVFNGKLKEVPGSSGAVL